MHSITYGLCGHTHTHARSIGFACATLGDTYVTSRTRFRGEAWLRDTTRLPGTGEKDMLRHFFTKSGSRHATSALQGPGVSSGGTLPPQTKPPNVLVLAADQREKQQADQFFFSVKEGLTACLDEERYVVYPLSPEDAVRAPWKDNCSLLVVTSGLQPEILSAGVLHEIASYVQSGGTLLSMDSVTNAAFGFRVPEHFLRAMLVAVTLSTSVSDGEGEVTASDEYIAVQTCTRAESLPDTFPALGKKLSTVLAKMKMRGEGTERVNDEGEDVGEVGGTADVDCIQHVRFEDSSGQAVLSHVDFLRPAGSCEASVSELVALKRDAKSAVQLLQTVLQGIGMVCSQRESSSPTPSYLICSDQVHVCTEPSVRNFQQRRKFTQSGCFLIKRSVVIGHF